MKRKTTIKAALPHEGTITLPDDRVLEHGDEFTVKGEGRFVFAYEYKPDGSVTAWGPINKSGGQLAQWRSFDPDRVTRIHRKTINRKTQQ